MRLRLEGGGVNSGGKNVLRFPESPRPRCGACGRWWRDRCDECRRGFVVAPEGARLLRAAGVRLRRVDTKVPT
jgi:hypothetical protein